VLLFPIWNNYLQLLKTWKCVENRFPFGREYFYGYKMLSETVLSNDYNFNVYFYGVCLKQGVKGLAFEALQRITKIRPEISNFLV